MDLTQHSVDHHVDSLTAIIAAAPSILQDDVLDRHIEQSVEGVDDDPTLRGLLNGMVTQEEHWLSALRGGAWPDESDQTVAGLAAATSAPAATSGSSSACDRRRGEPGRHLRRHHLRAAVGALPGRHDRPRHHLRRRPPHDGRRGLWTAGVRDFDKADPARTSTPRRGAHVTLGAGGDR